MKIVEAGHVYDLSGVAGLPEEQVKTGAVVPNQRIIFVNREPGTEHDGTQTQEVLRALIDRTRHCDNCLRWGGNDQIIYHLRMALILHECRTLERKVAKGLLQAERIAVDPMDGHIIALIEILDKQASFEDPLVCKTDFSEKPTYCPSPKEEIDAPRAPACASCGMDMVPKGEIWVCTNCGSDSIPDSFKRGI